MPASRLPLDGRPVIDIEAALVWAYREQRVHEVLDHGTYLHAIEAAVAVQSWSLALPQSCLARGAAAELRADNAYLASHCRAIITEDAVTLHQAVLALPRALGGLVMLYAARGDRPDWGARIREVRIEVQWFERPIREGGAIFLPHGWYAFHATHTRKLLKVCAVRCVDQRRLVEAARARYSAWFSILGGLASALDGRLERRRLAPPRCACAPWAEMPP